MAASCSALNTVEAGRGPNDAFCVLLRLRHFAILVRVSP